MKFLLWFSLLVLETKLSVFGSTACATYSSLIQNVFQNSASLVERIVGAEHFEQCKELSGYLEDSFGNAQRVDYGTGHETTFFVFLCCLYKALVLKRSDLPATILLAFPAYLKVCRHLQTVYWLEPAGSHGVWCLDDYQLLPFVFGSAQLIGRPGGEMGGRERGDRAEEHSGQRDGRCEFDGIYVSRSHQVYLHCFGFFRWDLILDENGANSGT